MWLERDSTTTVVRKVANYTRTRHETRCVHHRGTHRTMLTPLFMSVKSLVCRVSVSENGKAGRMSTTSQDGNRGNSKDGARILRIYCVLL